MGTQTIVIGQTCTTKKLVPIEFNKFLSASHEFLVLDCVKPTDYKFIELIAKNHGSCLSSLDLMFAYQNPLNRENGVLILGKWNDGVVE